MSNKVLLRIVLVYCTHLKNAAGSHWEGHRIYIMYPIMVLQQSQNCLQDHIRIIFIQSCSAAHTRPNLANVDPWLLYTTDTENARWRSGVLN